ncbi:MAG: aminodeoxychorismate synthase component I, partial [Tannerellaceae bacterium]|nr:aminodeoxychorismate synthase component I [Tannerellaceae bacterium]
MKQYSKSEALARMNQLGEAGKPFLFIIDYKQEQILLEETFDVNPDECLYNLNGFTNVQEQDDS